MFSHRGLCLQYFGWGLSLLLSGSRGIIITRVAMLLNLTLLLPLRREECATNITRYSLYSGEGRELSVNCVFMMQSQFL